MAKKSFFLAKIQAEYEKKLAEKDAEIARLVDEARHFGRVYQMDMVTLALGRMGWGEVRFKRLDQLLLEVTKEISQQVLEDVKDDPDIWKTKADLDRELKQYVGDMFVPYDERYAY